MRSDGALSQTESYEGGKIMKMSEVEFSSREECPVREVCYARNCGDPDHCIFANLSEADLDIEVDEYLRVGLIAQRAIEDREDREIKKAKLRHERAKKAATTRKLIQSDPQVKKAKQIKNEIRNRILCLENINRIANAFSFADLMMPNGRSENDKDKNKTILTKTEIEIEKLKKDYEQACINLIITQKARLQEVHKEVS